MNKNAGKSITGTAIYLKEKFLSQEKKDKLTKIWQMTNSYTLKTYEPDMPLMYNNFIPEEKRPPNEPEKLEFYSVIYKKQDYLYSECPHCGQEKRETFYDESLERSYGAFMPGYEMDDIEWNNDFFIED